MYTGIEPGLLAEQNSKGLEKRSCVSKYKLMRWKYSILADDSTNIFEDSSMISSVRGYTLSKLTP